jgi:ribosomal protein S1
LQRALHTNETVEGVIFRCVRRGYLVDFGGVTGFLPGSQLNTLPVVDIAPFLDHAWSFKILNCDPEHGRLIVSRRATLPRMEVENVDLDKKYCVGQHLTASSPKPYPSGHLSIWEALLDFCRTNRTTPK